MPRSIDENAQRKRRQSAWKSVIAATAWLSVSALLLLYLRGRYVPDGLWSAVMLIAAMLELGMVIPVWILLKTRLKEIEGGEEDAAAQY